MFFRKYHYAISPKGKNDPHSKTGEIHNNSVKYPNLKLSISLLALLTFWFLFLFFRFPPTTTTTTTAAVTTDSSHHDTQQKLVQFPAKPVSVCKENLSIYVYDLPAKFNLGLLDDCRHLNVYTDMCPHVANRGLGQPLPESDGGGGSWFATHQFIAEMIFHARVENHPCRTRDPEQATLFYVPFYGGLHASSKFREPQHAARDALAVELSEYVVGQPWWRKRGGKDHFLALGRTAWDFMRTTNSGPDFGANRLLNLPPVQNMSVLTVERHPWQGSNQYGIPYPSYFHPSAFHEIETWQDNMGRVDRPDLFSFVGAPRAGLQKAAVRDEIIRQCAESSRCNLLRCGRGASRCHRPREVLRVMTGSNFCLQAPGDSFTRRSTFDSVLAGCIPVFFSPHTAYSQYGWYFPADASEYSVFIDEERNASRIGSIEEVLMKIPAEKVKLMRRTVIGLIPRITYAHPNSTDYGFRDAVDVALVELSNHIYEI